MIEIVREQREETESRYAGISELPTKYVGLGDVLKIGGQGHRPYLRPRDAKNCDGCSLKNHQKECEKVQCSKPDRKDGVSVFFKRVY